MEALGNSIGVFDSGLGGLSVLRLIPAALPRCSFVYFADSAFAPYGARSKREIAGRSSFIADLLLDYLNCEALVIACNTATAAAVKELRLTYPSAPIIGMEPAVKPAAESTQTGKVGVMATASTIDSEKYGRLLEAFGKNIEVFEDPCVGLVELIENGVTGVHLEKKLISILNPMLDNGVDTVVLGCTHFPLITAQIQEVVGSKVRLINPAPAVVRQVLKKAKKIEQASGLGREHQKLFITSGDVVAFRQNVTRIVPHLAAGALFQHVEEVLKPPSLRIK